MEDGLNKLTVDIGDVPTGVPGEEEPGHIGVCSLDTAWVSTPPTPGVWPGYPAWPWGADRGPTVG